MIKQLLFRQFARTRHISRWFRQRLTPAGMLVAGSLITAAVFSIDTRRTLAFQLFAILAVLMLIAWLLMVFSRRPGPALQRILPDHAILGQPCHYRIRVINNGSHALQDVILTDELDTPLPDFETFMRAPEPPGGAGNRVDRYIGYQRWQALVRRWCGADLPPTSIPALSTGGQYTLNLHFEPLRRGWLHFSGVRLERPEPFGLLKKPQWIELRDSLLVLPRCYPVPTLRLDGRRRYQAGGLHAATSVGDALEFKSLREYRPGDPLRHIHWRSFAKTGYPIVKEYQEEYFARQGLILDTFAHGATDAEFEAAVSVAASLINGPRHPDSLIDLLFVEQRAFHLTAGRGQSSTSHLLEVVACIEPQADDDFARLADHVCSHAPQLGGAVCVLLGDDPPRLKLVQNLRASGVTTLALHITEAAAAYTHDMLIPLHPAHLETGLQDLANRIGRHE